MREKTSDILIKRNQSIDTIKIVAMLGVISLHCNLGKLENPVAFVLSRMAGISIPLFFMVSGYLLVNKQTDIHYSIKKIFGILKFVLICSACYWCGQMIYHKELNIKVIYIFSNAFIKKGFFGMFWYFGAMCLIYAILPVLKRLDTKYSLFYPKLLGVLICVDFVIFILTYQYHFEYSIIQTFRLWNWLTYFSIGAIIHKYHVNIAVPFTTVLLSMIVFVVFVYYCKSVISGIEYYFVTPLCMAYSFLLFIHLESKKIINNTIVAKLSKLFLPVYTLHYLIIKNYYHIIDTQYVGIITPLTNFLIISAITLILCYIIMRIPFAEKIFKI